jgi:hypothetical protein
MFAKTPLMDRLVVNVSRGLGQETLKAIGDTKFDRCGLAILGPAGTPQVQSCPLCLEPSHLRNHCRHWDALDAYRPNHRVVNIHINHLLRHRCLAAALCCCISPTNKSLDNIFDRLGPKNHFIVFPPFSDLNLLTILPS